MNPPPPPTQGRKFLGVHFVTCNTYGRLYLNAQGNAYVGNCPKCGQPHRITAAAGGAKVNLLQIICAYGRYHR